MSVFFDVPANFNAYARPTFYLCCTQKLPVGIQSFEKLREDGGYIYIDKTAYIFKMLNRGGEAFFLSRPRRFGKSLFLDAVRCVFDGRKDLFEGLYIYDKIAWEKRPVILLDMGGMALHNPEMFSGSLFRHLQKNADTYNMKLTATNPVDAFDELILALYRHTGKRLVILVDEYDKPILDAIHNMPMAQEFRELLRNFYTVMKSASRYLRFVMLTGVSKIAQVAVFSGLNNL